MNDNYPWNFIIWIGIVAVLGALLIMGVVFICGPILGLYTLVKGWGNTRMLIKIGAVIFTILGLVAIIYTLYMGDVIIIFGSPDLTVLAFILQILSAVLIGIAFYRHANEFKEI